MLHLQRASNSLTLLLRRFDYFFVILGSCLSSSAFQPPCPCLICYPLCVVCSAFCAAVVCQAVADCRASYYVPTLNCDSDSAASALLDQRLVLEFKLVSSCCCCTGILCAVATRGAHSQGHAMQRNSWNTRKETCSKHTNTQQVVMRHNM